MLSLFVKPTYRKGSEVTDIERQDSTPFLNRPDENCLIIDTLHFSVYNMNDIIPTLHQGVSQAQPDMFVKQ